MKFTWTDATKSNRVGVVGMVAPSAIPVNILIYGGKNLGMLAQINDNGNVTYSDNLTLDEAKEAIRILLEKILEMQK